jgi:hypothetical protein
MRPGKILLPPGLRNVAVIIAVAVLGSTALDLVSARSAAAGERAEQLLYVSQAVCAVAILVGTVRQHARRTPDARGNRALHSRLCLGGAYLLLALVMLVNSLAPVPPNSPAELILCGACFALLWWGTERYEPPESGGAGWWR